MAGRHQGSAAVPKVPDVNPWFWTVKILTTAMGEAVSDFLVKEYNPYLAVLAGFIVFAVAITWQFRVPDYRTWPYWTAVAMVAVFGTMVADAMHVGLGVPYKVSVTLFAVALAVVLFTWYRVEGTLSIHSIVTPRREIFYWLTVCCTFALGTATGDLTATTLHLGYFTSGVLFTLAIMRAAGGVAARGEPRADVLGGLHPDPADRGVVRGLLRDAEDVGRPRDRARARVAGHDSPGGGLHRLPSPDGQGPPLGGGGYALPVRGAAGLGPAQHLQAAGGDDHLGPGLLHLAGSRLVRGVEFGHP